MIVRRFPRPSADIVREFQGAPTAKVHPNCPFCGAMPKYPALPGQSPWKHDRSCFIMQIAASLGGR